MVSFLRTWANQIIVAVIIATIIEMIIPNGNNKKYIQMVIGIYVLFTVLQPAISGITGKNLEKLDFNYEKYFDNTELEVYSTDFENTNSKLIEQTYINSIKKDIETKIVNKGYDVEKCSIKLKSTEDKDTYEISEIYIKILSSKQPKNESINQINIKSVEINAKNNATTQSNIKESERKVLTQYLANEYSIEEKNIIIN